MDRHGEDHIELGWFRGSSWGHHVIRPEGKPRANRQAEFVEHTRSTAPASSCRAEAVPGRL